MSQPTKIHGVKNLNKIVIGIAIAAVLFFAGGVYLLNMMVDL